MAINLLYLTKDPDVGRIAEGAGVDWIFVDLEYRGKAERQAGRNTVISAHTLDDVADMRRAVTRARLLVRVNPIGEWSADEIDGAIDAGADILMLPFFTDAVDVEKFVDRVAGRAETCLLVETMGAVGAIDSILDVPGVDRVHVGLNDIHVERGTRFMFEFLADGSLDALAAKFRARDMPFGFGGMARIGSLVPPAEAILAEHYRLGSTAVILARAFCNTDTAERGEVARLFERGVAEVRAYEAMLKQADPGFFEINRQAVRSQIQQVAADIAARADR